MPKKQRGMRELRVSNPDHVCSLCGHRGNIGQHIRWRHPETTYREYVEKYYSKHCENCGKQIRYDIKRAQYSIVKNCSRACAAKQQSLKLKGRRGRAAGSWRTGRFLQNGYTFVNIWGLDAEDRKLAVIMQAN